VFQKELLLFQVVLSWSPGHKRRYRYPPFFVGLSNISSNIHLWHYFPTHTKVKTDVRHTDQLIKGSNNFVVFHSSWKTHNARRRLKMSRNSRTIVSHGEKISIMKYRCPVRRFLESERRPSVDNKVSLLSMEQWRYFDNTRWL